MTAPTAIEASTELSNVLLQTDGGGGLSLDVIIVIGILAVVALAIGWMLWGGSGGTSD